MSQEYIASYNGVMFSKSKDSILQLYFNNMFNASLSAREHEIWANVLYSFPFLLSTFKCFIDKHSSRRG